jgi:hypothetical protein
MTQLSDLRLAAQQRCDRVNASTITTAEWNGYVNASAARLYRALTGLYEDYNVSQYPFVLAGGAGGNTLPIGNGTGVPAFDKLRHISRIVIPAGQLGGVEATYAPVLRADSPMEFDQLSAPVLMPYYGGLTQRVKYWLYGQTIEIRPAASAGASYVLWYIPSYTKLVNDSDTIDSTWMATNGIDEYVVVDAAIKALVKEESDATLLVQEREAMRAEIMQQFAQRDDGQPGRIVDVKLARDSFMVPWLGR